MAPYNEAGMESESSPTETNRDEENSSNEQCSLVGLSRRQFLQSTAATGAALTFTSTASAATSSPQIDSATLTTGENWVTSTVSDEFSPSSRPVVVGGPISDEGGDPAHVRLREVSPDNFDARIEEWDYLNDIHYDEDFGTLVAAEGRATAESGHSLEARVKTGLKESWETVHFDTDFESSPVVFTTVQTYNGTEGVITRNRNISTSDFETRLQAHESDSNSHKLETIGAFGVEPGTGTINGVKFEAGTLALTDSQKTLNFSQSFDNTPVLIADIQTFKGSDPCNVRYNDLNSNSVDLFIDDGTSDDDSGHVEETVGFLAIESDIPEPWENQDVGSGVDGAATYNSSDATFDLNGEGDIGGTSDTFHFIHQKRSGDTEIIAEVQFLEDTDKNAKAGVMIRDNDDPLQADAPHVFMGISPDSGSGAALKWRDSPGGSTNTTHANEGATVPHYMKIARNGNTFTGYISPDGSSWSKVDSVTFDMSERTQVGMATSSDRNYVAASTYGNITVSKPVIPLGGGEGYDRIIEESDDAVTKTVSDVDTFKSEVEGAASGDVIYVTTDLNLGNLDTEVVEIPEGVTVASNRGVNGAPGYRLYTDNHLDYSRLRASGENARLTGIRLEGPETEYFAYDSSKADTGAAGYNPGFEVDNCEIYGWPKRGVELRDSGDVHHCHIHHCQMDGYGYGVDIGLDGDDGDTFDQNQDVPRQRVKMWMNKLDYTRHPVQAAAGGGSWILEDSWIGPHSPVAHGLDHHGPESEDIVTIRNVTIEADEYGYEYSNISNGKSTGIRMKDDVGGVPKSLNIENVWFFHSGEDVDGDGETERPSAPGDVGDAASSDYGVANDISNWNELNTYWTNNHFGETEPSDDIGHPR